MTKIIFVKVNEQLEIFIQEKLNQLKLIKEFTQEVEFIKKHQNLFLKVTCIGDILEQIIEKQWFDQLVHYFAKLPISLFPYYSNNWTLSKQNLMVIEWQIQIIHPILILVIQEKYEIENRLYKILELDREFVALYSPFNENNQKDQLITFAQQLVIVLQQLQSTQNQNYFLTFLSSQIDSLLNFTHLQFFLRKYIKNDVQNRQSRSISIGKNIIQRANIIESIRILYSNLLTQIAKQNILQFQGSLKNERGQQIFTGKILNGQPQGKGYLWNTEKDNNQWKRIIFNFPLQDLQKGQIILKNESKFMII